MDILLDQNLPRKAAGLLRVLGHDAVHTEDIGHRTTKDPDLIRLALAQGRFIATMDKGFCAIIALRNLKAPSIILLRVDDPDDVTTSEIIHRICTLHAEDLRSGSIITVEDDSIRVKPLPMHLLK